MVCIVADILESMILDTGPFDTDPLDAAPSRTALTAAAARAAHLLVDDAPVIFADTLAARLLGDAAEELLAYHRLYGTSPVLAGARTEVLCRSRFTEDLVARSGLTQHVVLGAGLDTFGYRQGARTAAGQTPPTVFEVDHPATQAWKRRALDAAGIAVPADLVLVPVDLETDALVEALVARGFDSSRPATVSWLGVTMYLTAPAIASTLDALGGLAPGTQLVADYVLPAHLRDDAARAYADAVGPVAAESGEPWLSFFAPDELTDLLTARGFTSVRHVSQADSVDPSLWARTDALRPMALSGLVHATV